MTRKARLGFHGDTEVLGCWGGAIGVSMVTECGGGVYSTILWCQTVKM